MPRTKQPRKPKTERHSVDDSASWIKVFERQAQLRIAKMEADSKMKLKGLETFADLTLSRLPPEIRQMTLGELLASEDLSEIENCNEVSSSVDDHLLLPPAPATVKAQKVSKRITAASDDGYVTEGVATASRVSRKAKASEASTRRTRSTSRNNRTKLSEIQSTAKAKGTGKRGRPPTSTMTDIFKTPGVLKPNCNEYSVVTPKVKPNTPLSVLRRPRQGEMVLSMQGSPLLVSSDVERHTAKINVPLKNGNVISLLPNDGLRMSHIPTLDPETMKQLETLKNHLETVIKTVN